MSNMTMKHADLVKLVGLMGKCGYNLTNKTQFKLLSTRLLRATSKALIASGDILPGDAFEVRYNAGGIAVSGDATLHHERVYVSMNADGFLEGVLIRSCKGLKDYTGGANRWFDYTRLVEDGGFEAFVRFVASVMSPIAIEARP